MFTLTVSFGPLQGDSRQMKEFPFQDALESCILLCFLSADKRSAANTQTFKIRVQLRLTTYDFMPSSFMLINLKQNA